MTSSTPRRCPSPTGDLSIETATMSPPSRRRLDALPEWRPEPGGDRPDPVRDLATVGVLGEPDIVVSGLTLMLLGMHSPFLVRGFERVDAHTEADLLLVDVARSDDPKAHVASLLRRPGIARVVAFVWDSGAPCVREAVAAGALGVISKRSSRVHVHAAMRHFLPEVIGPDPRGEQLQGQQARVIRLVARGWDDAAIMGALGISVNTLKSHLRLAYRRAGVTSRAEAVVWAMGHEPPA